MNFYIFGMPCPSLSPKVLFLLLRNQPNSFPNLSKIFISYAFQNIYKHRPQLLGIWAYKFYRGEKPVIPQMLNRSCPWQYIYSKPVLAIFHKHSFLREESWKIALIKFCTCKAHIANKSWKACRSKLHNKHQTNFDWKKF